MTVIEYFDIDEDSINGLRSFFIDRHLGMKIIEQHGSKTRYANPMPYIKIVNLDDDFINFPNPLAILVLECYDYNEFSTISSAIDLTAQLDDIFGENNYFLIPVYGKEVDIKAIAKSDSLAELNATTYKRLGLDISNYKGIDPSNTIKIDTYKSPSRLMLL